jgi:hypothetical protein
VLGFLGGWRGGEGRIKKEKLTVMKCRLWKIASVLNLLYPSKMAPLHSVNFVEE